MISFEGHILPISTNRSRVWPVFITLPSLLLFVLNTYYKSRQRGITINDSSDYYKLRQQVITIHDRYVITIHDNCYYNSRQVLQFLTNVITIHDRYYNSPRYYNSRQNSRGLGRGSCGAFTTPFLQITSTNRKGLVLHKM